MQSDILKYSLSNRYWPSPQGSTPRGHPAGGSHRAQRRPSGPDLRPLPAPREDQHQVRPKLPGLGSLLLHVPGGRVSIKCLVFTYRDILQTNHYLSQHIIVGILMSPWAEIRKKKHFKKSLSFPSKFFDNIYTRTSVVRTVSTSMRLHHPEQLGC